MCVVWSYWNTRDWAPYNWNVPHIHGTHVIKWHEMSFVFARIKQSVTNATDVLFTLVQLVFVWCMLPPHCPFTISFPLIVTMNQHSVWVELVLSTPLGKKTCWARLCFESQSREIKIAWVNGRSTFDFVKVAKCLVLYYRLRLASKRVLDSTLVVLLADLCGIH